MKTVISLRSKAFVREIQKYYFIMELHLMLIND